ncbi:MAG: GNAT family N-acetyltransferase [Kangiellaceae bacterium]|nr:GNAT family N-acetyltransferase [Kangiellaceae bacterium]
MKTNNSRKVYLFYDINEFLSFMLSLSNPENRLFRSIIVSGNCDFSSSINNQPPPVITQDKVNQYLGQELDHLFYDARDDFSPNAFAAIIGCLVGGGSLALLLPNSMSDLNAVKNRVTTSMNEKNVCLVRLVDEFSSIQSICELSTRNSPNESTFYEPRRIEPQLSALFYEQQSKAIEMIKRVSLGHAKRPLVLTASRGRGKSASLGIAAAELVCKQKKEILVTSPSKANLDVFYFHFNNRLKDLSNPPLYKTVDIENNTLKNKITFLPLDKLILKKNIDTFLIVEEAGAIPVQILKKISNRANRVIYSTTTDGYEGNGQGFKIRFMDFLDSKFRQWKSYQLTYPARYSVNDPIEKAVNNALLFSNEQTTFHFKTVDLDKVEYRVLPRRELRFNEPLLKQVYNLLLTAHYQTRPSDLERLLSDKNMLIYIAIYNNQVLSAALVLKEGPLTQEQCSKIEQGKLRLAGHLLPQSLMAHQGIERAGLLEYWRVMRIATHSEFRNTSLATLMINQIKKDAFSSTATILGACFALQNLVVKFWYKQKFVCNRIGLRKDSSTGELSCEFLFLVDKEIDSFKHVFTKLTDSFNRHFTFYLNSNYRNIDVNILIQMLTKQVVKDNIEPSHSEHELIRYIDKARSFEMVEWHLYQFLIYYLASSKLKFNNLTHRQKTLVFKKVLQNTTWECIIEQLDYSGKKEISKELREIFRLLLKA